LKLFHGQTKRLAVPDAFFVAIGYRRCSLLFIGIFGKNRCGAWGGKAPHAPHLFFPQPFKTG
jgi:hypothetical protein